jgi:hypothetical protein
LVEHGIVCVLVCGGPDRLVVGRFFITELVFCGLTMRSRYCDECSMKTLLINDTTQVIRIREGNAGVYTTYAKLDPGEIISLTVDVNATYREFDFIVGGQKLESLSWDDYAEYVAITFFDGTANGSVDWRGTQRDKSSHKLKVLICIHTPHCIHSRVLFNSLLFTKSYNYN